MPSLYVLVEDHSPRGCLNNDLYSYASAFSAAAGVAARSYRLELSRASSFLGDVFKLRTCRS